MGQVVRLPARDTKASTGYRFIDKDPILDIVVYAMDTSGLAVWQIAAKARVSISTLIAWRKGKTKRPQAHTVRRVLEACGSSMLIRDGDRRVARVPLQHTPHRRNWSWSDVKGLR